MEPVTLNKIWTKLIQVETNLSNHLRHHENWLKFIFAPILVGVTLILLKLYILE